MAQTPKMIMPSNPPRSPIVAALLSFFFLGGAGHLYLRQTSKGIALMVVTFLLYFVLGIGCIVNIVGAIDAYIIATKLQQGQPVKEWQFFG